MRHRHWLVMAALLLMLVPLASAEKARAVAKPRISADAVQRVSTLYTPEEIQKGVYVGSNFCLACHTTMSTYKDTNHSSFLRKPLTKYSLQPGRGVIADYDANGVDDFIQGLDFNKINSAFDKYKPNAPVLSVENGAYYITIGSMKMPVWFTLAGQRSGSSQRFTVKVPVTDTPNKLSSSVYFAPLQYSPSTGWAVYSGQYWYDSTNAPKYAAGIGSAALAAQSGNHTSGCIGCHAAGIRSLAKTPAGEWAYEGWTAVLYEADDPTIFDYDGDGDYEIVNIGCENCHGPGAAHIIAAGNPNKIVNPAKLEVPQQAQICGRCHVTGKSVPAGTFGWPYDDATMTNWTPFDAKAGTPLSNFFTDTTALYPDGKHSSGGRPYHDYTISAHANFDRHRIGCPDCHDPHEEGEGMLIRESRVQSNLTIKTAVEDNSLCLSCHATHGPFETLTAADIQVMNTDAAAFDKVAKVVETHTHHPFAPERMMGLSRCVGCHMSVAAGHSFHAIGPEETLKYQDKGGMANSCANGCHNNRVDIFNIGVKGSASGWNNPFDVKLSNKLKVYFGENGIWWKTVTTP